MTSILLTGATGFLGREMLLHLGNEEKDTNLTLLVRGKDDEDARRRGDKLVNEVFGARAGAMKHRVRTVRGDIEKDRLGLDSAAWDRLAKETSAIIHGAASVSFTLPIDEARNVNVGGTRRILDLAKAANARLDYVGTAYVAGERRGIAKERELDEGQTFRNTYEQTKMEAEKLVRSRMGEQKIAIYRPSIIVGDSKTGRTASFKVLYWPLKLYAQGFAKIAPGKRTTPVDVVPSDYVVEAIAAIRKREDSIGQTYHLAAGTERDSTIGELTDLASKFFGVRKPLFVDPRYFIDWVRPLIDRFAWGKFKHKMVTARVYTPYLNLDLRYDTQNARNALRGTGIEVPPVAQYFQTLFDYCIQTDWGRNLAA